ncbi:MAG: hypothetical protein PHI97_04005 [Desulfobulbus sp.]|nr:hypothetical protein [Desulfobulbus sp.]
MLEVEEYPGGYNEPEEENLLTGDEPDNTDEEGGDASKLPGKIEEITLELVSTGTTVITKVADRLTPQFQKDLDYFIETSIDNMVASHFYHYTTLATQFNVAEYYTTKCAIAVSTLHRIKFGNILCKLKELHKKCGKGKWEDFADDNFGISKETRILYMRISRINGVENYAFLGIEKLREVNVILKKLKIDGENQIEELLSKNSAAFDTNTPVKEFKRILNEILKKANMKPGKGSTPPAKEGNTEPQGDGDSPDTAPPSSENGASTPGNNENKKLLNQESLNRGIHKLIESVDTFFELEFGEDVLSVEIIDNFQSKLTELNDKLEMLKDKITNI